jgi:hypothetical protein
MIDEFSEFITIKEMLDSARDEINKEGFKYFNIVDDSEENFYTLESLYIQWVEDEEKGKDALWAMFEEECPEHF